MNQSPSPTDTLRQIVMDSHKLKERMRDPMVDSDDLRNAIERIAESVRALAEAVLQVQMQLTREE